MQLDLSPRAVWDFPSRFPSLFDEDNWSVLFPSTGLTISENNQNVFVEAAVPGLNPEEIEVVFDNGILTINGKKQETTADKEKSFYRKATRTFSYRVTVPGSIDEKIDPVITCHNGILTATFTKLSQTQPKKLAITPL